MDTERSGDGLRKALLTKHTEAELASERKKLDKEIPLTFDTAFAKYERQQVIRKNMEMIEAKREREQEARREREQEARRRHLDRVKERTGDEQEARRRHLDRVEEWTGDEQEELRRPAVRQEVNHKEACPGCMVMSPRARTSYGSTVRSSRRIGRGGRLLSSLSTKKLYTSPRRKVSRTSRSYRTRVRRRGSKRGVRSRKDPARASSPRRTRFRSRAKSKRASRRRGNSRDAKKRLR